MAETYKRELREQIWIYRTPILINGTLWNSVSVWLRTLIVEWRQEQYLRHKVDIYTYRYIKGNL